MVRYLVHVGRSNVLTFTCRPEHGGAEGDLELRPGAVRSNGKLDTRPTEIGSAPFID